jgi:hypothetical protein
MHFARAERLEKTYSYSVLENVYVIGRCPISVNELVPELSAIKVGLTQLNVYFLSNIFNDTHYVLEILCTREKSGLSKLTEGHNINSERFAVLTAVVMMSSVSRI